MKRKILCGILSCLLSIVAATEALAIPHAPFGECGDNVNWKFENGTLTISGTGAMDTGNLSNDWPWHKYSSDNDEEDWILYYYARVTKIIVEDGVTEIGHHAFRNFSRLESVTIADSVTTIKYSAFYSCPKLSSITIGNGIKTIEYNAFQDCSALTEITLPGTIETIGDNVFQGCSNLKTITFKKPDSQHNLGIQNNSINAVVNYDGECALFDGEKRVLSGTPISYLSGKTIVLKYTTIDEGWCGSNMLWEVNKNDHVLTIKVCDPSEFGIKKEDDSKYDYKNETEVPWHSYRKDLKNVIIKEGITKIPNYALANCTTISEIVLPSTVTEIGSSAFENCAALSTVTFVTPSSISGKIKFRGKPFGNTTAVIRYEGEGVLKHDFDKYCLAAGSPLKNLGRSLLDDLVWVSNSTISFLVRSDNPIVNTTPGTEFSTTFRVTHKFGLVRDIKWSINNDVPIFGEIPSGDYKAEVTESNDNEAKVTFFVGTKPILFITEVTASCESFSQHGCMIITVTPPQNANAANVNAAASVVEIQREDATLNGKTGEPLGASYSANSSGLIWTLMPDSETLEHAKTFDIISSGDTAEIEAVFDRKGDYYALVLAKNLSGDIVDADALTFTVTDEENFTLAPDGLYFNLTAGEPKEASINIKSDTGANVDGVEWGVFWDEKPTSENITSTGSNFNITATWDTPGEYHALVTAASEECSDYTILTFSVAKTNIFELLLDKLFFSGTTGEEFDDASVLISGDVNPSEIQWTLNFDDKVVSEEELDFLYDEDGTSTSPTFDTEGEHQIQIVASKGDCTRSLTFTFITEAETTSTSNISNSSSSGCNFGVFGIGIWAVGILSLIARRLPLL